MIFFEWKYGLAGLGLATGGFWFSNKTGNELDISTVGELSEKITREYYLKSRRNSKTINKGEIDKVLEDWFVNFLRINKPELTQEAILIEKTTMRQERQ